jgi:hypothetical protein
MRDESTCFKCGANAWTSCEHRDALREKPVFEDGPTMVENQKKVSGGGRYRIQSTAIKKLNLRKRK